MNKPLRSKSRWVRMMSALAGLFIFSYSLHAQDCGDDIVIVGSDYVCLHMLHDYTLQDTFTGALGNWSIEPANGGTITTAATANEISIDWDGPPGEYDVIVELVDYRIGCVGPFYDTLTVMVEDNFGSQLACNDSVQVSLGTDCSALVTPDLVLEGGASMNEDFEVYVIEANGDTIPDAVLDGSHANMTLKVSIYHICSGNSCWGWLKVEDKLAPTLACSFYEIECDEDPTPGVIVGFPISDTTAVITENTDGSYTVEGIDSCGPVTLTYVDDVVSNDCPPLLTHLDTIYRSWSAEDESGNISECVDTIAVLIGNIDSVVCPPNYDDIDFSALACRDSFEVDQNGNPSPEVTGYPTGVGCRNIDYDYVDYKLGVCAGSYKIIREWLIADWCTNTTIYCNQIIKVKDEDGPLVNCPPNDTFSVNSFECLGEAIVPDPYDFIVPDGECSSIESVEVLVKRGAPGCRPEASADETTEGVSRLANGDYRIINLPLGCNWVVYRYYDACGNSTDCRFDVFIKEDKKPVAVCDQHTVVTLSTTGRAKVFASTFDDGSYDNCEVDSFAVARMTRGDCPRGVIDDTNFRSYVEFCCADAAQSPVMVVFRVYDRSGNFNECMVEINVVDKQRPTLVCPPNITVSCDFDYTSLNDFGFMRDDIDDRESIIIDDPSNPNTAPNFNWGLDGYYGDDCQANLSYEIEDRRNDCGVGSILRIWTVNDASQSVSCSQSITFMSFNNFHGAGIDWPSDTILDGCPSDIDPSITGEPVLPDTNNCVDLLVSFDDQVYDFVPDACYKILRTWTVVDWCNNDVNNNRWYYTQVIKIHNTEDPTFVSGCEDVTFDTDDPNCEGFAELAIEVDDDCTPVEDIEASYTIDANKDGIIDFQQSGTLDASNTFPVGTHEICWTIEDNCGNTNTCCHDFTIRDQKPPTPYCRTGIVTVVMPTSGEITIWASDLDDNSFDNCTPRRDLRYSFSSDVDDRTRTYDCSDIPNGIEETFEVTIYVTDADGNQDYCTTMVTIQDGVDDVCPDSLTGNTAMLAGNIQTEAAEMVEEVMVMLDGSMPGLPKYNMTKNDGHYAFPSIPTSNNYKLEASRNDDPLNGISTLDLVLIQRHLLGISSFNTPYKYIAADINNTQSVSVGDISELRKLILGYYNDFPDNNSWRFVPSSQQFSDPNDPWPFEEVVEVDNLSGNQMANDFVAIKIGDISGDARANGLIGNIIRSGGEITLTTKDVTFTQGQTFNVEISLPKGAYHGLQYAIQFDANSIQLVDVQHDSGLTSDANLGLTQLQNGVIALSWNTVNGSAALIDDVFMTLSFEAINDGVLSEILSLNTKTMNAEAYNAHMEVSPLAFNFVDRDGEVIASSHDFQLMQNKPNPFDNSTVIGFNLPRTQEATIKILDVTGKIVKEISGMFAKGYNQVEVSKANLRMSGVLYYRLETDDRMATRKMILIE